MTVLLLVDAFRWDYIARTGFIGHLASQGATGNFVEPFGFVPRGAYFGGLTPGETGFSHMYHRDPEHSPFGLSAGFLRLSKEVLFTQDGPFRQRIASRCSAGTTDFGASYLSTLNIPLHLLGEFQLSELHAPWEPGHGYTSLFDLLDAQDRKWFQCSWPLCTRLPRSDDRSLAEHCLGQIKPHHEFVYIHLSELDWCGHLHGPESKEIREKIGQVTDPCVEILYQHCLKVSGGDLTFILFGDHGMVTITKTIDLWDALQRSGLKIRHDYMCFLDSTMARFWFQHEAAKEQITALLHTFQEGTVLEAADLRKHHIIGCPPSNAELIFLAHPGVVIQPNFFEFSTKCGIRGMHGYDPDCRDNQGAIIVHNAREAVPRQFDRGVQAWELFPLLLDDLKIEHPTPHRMPATRSTPEQGFTPVAEAEPTIREQVRFATEEIAKTIPEAQVIYLSGGFGRGEGTVQKNGGGYRPINDYDFGVIVNQPKYADFKSVGGRIAEQLGIDYVDINVTSAFNKQWGACQSNFDLRYGTRVLVGDPRSLEKLPCYSATEIPTDDALKLVFNRAAGVLTVPNEDKRAGFIVASGREDYFSYQIAKLLLGLGDAMLIGWKAYDVSYATKRERIGELLRGHPEFTSQEIAAIDYGYAVKLSQEELNLAQSLAHAGKIPALIEKALPTICQELGQPKPSLKACYHAGNVCCRRERTLPDADGAQSSAAAPSTMIAPPAGFFQKLILLTSCLLAEDHDRPRYWESLRPLWSPEDGAVLHCDFNWAQALLLKESYRTVWENHHH